jgi:hypothetical protein
LANELFCTSQYQPRLNGVHSNSRLISQSECCIHKILNYFFIFSGADEGKWNRTSILLLLDEYKKYLKNFNDPKMKKKATWGKISQILKEKGFDIDGVKCERKLIHKKSKYKSTKIHNKQTGNNPKTCPCYQELDDIFGNSPAISTLATCLNLKGIIIEEKK